eukprot:m.86351 g.86351  ORF g.86351 m.86351 type:complete len:385 (+) comp12801_c0_seq3:140-1294(+)
MAGIFHRSRGGNRGGQGDFDWEDVKVDKYRENYLGHSVKASVGRWQKGRDIHWWTRDKKGDDAEAARRQEKLRVEQALIQQQEQEMLAAALGLAPQIRRPAVGTTQLSQKDIIEAIGVSSAREEEGPTLAEKADRVSGLGFQSGKALTEEQKKQIAKGVKVFEGPRARGREKGHLVRKDEQMLTVPTEQSNEGSRRDSLGDTLSTSASQSQLTHDTGAQEVKTSHAHSKKQKKHKKHKKHKHKRSKEGRQDGQQQQSEAEVVSRDGRGRSRSPQRRVRHPDGQHRRSRARSQSQSASPSPRTASPDRDRRQRQGRSPSPSRGYGRSRGRGRSRTPPRRHHRSRSRSRSRSVERGRSMRGSPPRSRHYRRHSRSRSRSRSPSRRR